MSNKLEFRGLDREIDCMVFSEKVGLEQFFELVDDGRIDIEKVAQLVCLDKNENPVYAGDKVKYKLPNWKNKFKDCYVTEFRPPFYGYGLTDDDDFDFGRGDFLSSEIELVKEAT